MKKLKKKLYLRTNIISLVNTDIIFGFILKSISNLDGHKGSAMFFNRAYIFKSSPKKC